MWPKASFLAALQLGVCALALPKDQKLFPDVRFSSSASKVQAKLKNAGIIPYIIEDFPPELLLSVTWEKDHAKLGNEISPQRLQNQPSLSLYDDSGSNVFTGSNMKYVITMTDPDAPSRKDPKWSEFCHWIAANVSLSETSFSILPFPFLSSHDIKGRSDPDDVIEYKPPGPPPKTGKHRYVFLAFKPKNGTTEPLNLEVPKERQHWGTGEKRSGVKGWAKRNGLEPVAANFIYSKNKKQ